MTSENERWKNKYFDKLEEIERQESDFKEQMNTLQRLLIRVSLAAQGLDSKMDADLDKLRNLLRQESPSSSDLNRALDNVEKSVLALDQSRSVTAEGILQAFSSLVDRLLELELPRGQKKALKRYGKQLDSKISDLRHYPKLLSEYAGFLGDALQEVAGQSGAAPSQGFFGRLFAGQGASSPGAKTLSPESEEIPGVDELEEAESVAHTESETAEPYALEISASEPRPVSGEQFEPGFSAIADHVSATLSHLVQHLRLPDSMQADSQKVQQKIAGSLNWYELVPTLDDIANLVIAAFGRGQQEFESFLKSLDDRLVSIQSFFESSQASQTASKENSSELQEAVRRYVRHMQESMHEAENVEQLKLSVNTNLDSILVTLTQFMNKESERDAGLNAELENLQHRLRQLESESRDMQKQLVEEQQRAITDILTGLPNRMAYEQRAQQEFERWRRYKNPLTLVVVDIDKFKTVNDTYGHLAGDKVIQLIGKEISRRIRKTDFIARYGGEEFVILLPETDVETAVTVMEKTREMVSRLPFHFRNARVQVTISIGICGFSGNANLNGVFEMADKALYRAKLNGRNRVEKADSAGSV
ncbi:GGDEF domain-containing protein [Hahella sp. CCB-MM4]|uniref:GGDEF domain-containing protein n=1 Tax=Hahella sp. (strain CCB-MM4) TaxID=1926491 RepID=UPI000B9B1974|nr:diguanylate cyclase [Hahella sp. CCB-MM4]OZG74628.1 GGDEF domain-containing protein [Hahella sp. CCB-MM4]